MGKQSKYYWIKLNTNFFNLAQIDFLLSQSNGCEYIVLYQMLCLQTANNNGELNTRVGEMIIPYDADKIARDTKYFSKDTVLVAMELFKKLNLIYVQEDETLRITDFETMVGSETQKAELMRNKRAKDKQLREGNIVTKMLPQEKEHCYTEKEIDKDIELDKEIEINERLIDNVDRIYDLIGKVKFKQSDFEKYEEILKSKNLYFESIDILPTRIGLQVKLFYMAVKRIVDTNQTTLLDKLTYEKLEKVFGQVCKANDVENIVEYYISSLMNELSK